MALISKPINLSLTWASGGDVLNPGDTKYATGWQVEIPPRQWFNYLDNRQDTAIAHINQHGVAVWDAGTEYQAGKSYVQGFTTGAVYRSKQTHINQDPELDVGEVYWEFAFASPGDFYTKVGADAAFLAKASNLSDLPSTPDARANLSVYSKAETYTKTEVDAKTTVASTAQAEAWGSNSVLLTPLRLAEAFKGSNQTLLSTGKQALPGGFIMQWTKFITSASGFSTFTFPTTFPGALLGVVATSTDDAVSPTQRSYATVGPATASNVKVYATNSAGSQVPVAVFILAIGY